MNRRECLTVAGIAIFVPISGCLSEYQSRVDDEGSNADESNENSENDGNTTTDDERKSGIGSWQLSIAHYTDKSSDEIETGMVSDNAALSEQRFQDLFDEAVETGHAQYGTHDENEAATLQSIVEDIPEDEENQSRYVIHNGEVLYVRSYYLE